MSIFDSVLGLGKDIVSAVGGGPLFQAGASLLGGVMANSARSSNQSDAQAFSAEQYATRYQTQVKDLQAAGLNPMLAYSQGPGSAPQGQAAPVSDVVSPAVQSLQQARLNSAQMANIEADTENKKASANLIAGQAAQAWASAGQSDANVRQINATVSKIEEETKNIPVERDRLIRMVELLRNQSNLAFQQQLSESQRYEQLKATVSQIRAQTTLLDLDAKAAQTLDNLGRTTKEFAPIIQVLLSILRESRK